MDDLINEAVLKHMADQVPFINSYIKAYLKQTGMNPEDVQLVSNIEYTKTGTIRVTTNIERVKNANSSG